MRSAVRARICRARGRGLPALLLVWSLGVGLAGRGCGALPAEQAPALSAGEVRAVVLPERIRSEMSRAFTAHNQHWNELAELNTLEQMLGTVKPTQREYLGCLQGKLARDTVWVSGWVEAERLKQLQFAVAGGCDHVRGFIGSWHTHPYKADPQGLPMKQRGFSGVDLATFAQSRERVSIVIWDVDSLEAALHRADGSVLHPAPLVIR